MTKFLGTPAHRHDTPPCLGILLTNLGTPDEPTTAAVRRYLSQFLSDPRVIEVPRIIWWPVLHAFILRTRPARTAAAYGKVWTDEGSPLLVNTRRQAAALMERLPERIPGNFRLEVGMRYGSPSIADALERLRTANAQRLLVLPLYPQYSATTTASTFDAVADELRRWRWQPELRTVRHYHDHPAYISALAESVRDQWAAGGKPDRLLFSFHGLPRHYFLAGDPYFCECHKTARLVAADLELDDGHWEVAFQSRFGPREWLRPYTDELLQEWAGSGIRTVHMICPGFSADCLETLEEVQMQYRELFLSEGGERFEYIPALNDHPAHTAALVDLIARHCTGWPELEAGADRRGDLPELERTRRRAMSLGARQ